MKTIKTLAISTLFLLFMGCGGPKIAVLSSDKIQEVKSAKVATNFHMVNKKVNYIETLFRGLWLETKSSSMDISGIWNPDSDFNAQVNSNLSKLQLNNSQLVELGLQEELLNQYHEELNADYIENSVGEHSEIPGTSLPPAAEYFKKYPQVSSFESVRNYLLENGVDYYFEYLATDIYGNAPGYGMVIVTMPSQMRLIDLRTKEVVWTDFSWTHEVYQLGGDLKKLEEDNLKILKEGLSVGLNEVMDIQRIGPSFGITPPKS